MSLDAGRVGVRADQVDIHGRVTSPSFLNELLEDLPEWTDMPVWVNGTEELLPSNNSVPVTSPILTDIAYPDIRRDNQYFTYRESPTPVDGLAKIKSIKGNTLVWNQIYNVNSDRTNLGVNIKVVNGAVSITGTSNDIRTGPTFAWTDFKGVIGHKYIITKDFTLPSGDYIFDQYNLNSSTDITTVVFTLTNNDGYIIPQLRVAQTGVTYNISGHLCVYDLTKMFGAGNEPTTVEEFTSLFSLPYYDYNVGTLLSFNGNGIKTVGKNQFNYDDLEVGSIDQGNGNNMVNAQHRRTADFIPVINIKRYTSSNLNGRLRLYEYDENKTFITSFLIGNETFTLASNCSYFRLAGTSTYYNENTQIEIGSTVTSFEPYTSSTLSLPISTCFPSGMASAKNAYSNTMVYDELLPTKAIKRLVQYTFTGNETVSGITNIGTYYRCYIPISIPSKGTYATRWEKDVLNVYNYTEDSSHYYVQNSQFWYFTTSSTAEAIKAELSGTKFYYDLATPVELPTLSLGE